MKLSQLPNIGEVLAEKLEKIGVNSPDDLKRIGSENAIIKISTLEDSGACINMLYAIEGAIQGIRWHSLNRERKQELKEFYNMLKRKSDL